jgi:hypothetical protein
MVTKSIRLSESEAEEIAIYLNLVGGTEAALLKEATLRGLREIRLSRGILAYIEGVPPSEAARIAGLPRAPFLHALMDRGVTLLREPSTVGAELDALLAAEASGHAGKTEDKGKRSGAVRPADQALGF